MPHPGRLAILGAAVAAAGNGVDDLVKVDGQWFIKYRKVSAPDDK